MSKQNTKYEVGDLVGFLEYSIDDPRKKEIIDAGYVLEVFPVGHDMHNYICVFWQGLAEKRYDHRNLNAIILLEKGNKNVSD